MEQMQFILEYTVKTAVCTIDWEIRERLQRQLRRLWKDAAASDDAKKVNINYD